MRATPKREPRWQGVNIESQGEVFARIGFLILPDTYNPDAPLWQRRAGKNGVIVTRSRLAKGFRRWRSESRGANQRTQGDVPIARMLGWLIEQEYNREKEAAHV